MTEDDVEEARLEANRAMREADNAERRATAARRRATRLKGVYQDMRTWLDQSGLPTSQDV